MTTATIQVSKMTTAQVREVARFGFVSWAIELAADLVFADSDVSAIVAECKRRVVDDYAAE
jgi:hypothetical protein